MSVTDSSIGLKSGSVRSNKQAKQQKQINSYENELWQTNTDLRAKPSRAAHKIASYSWLRNSLPLSRATNMNLGKLKLT